MHNAAIVNQKKPLSICPVLWLAKLNPNIMRLIPAKTIFVFIPGRKRNSIGKK